MEKTFDVTCSGWLPETTGMALVWYHTAQEDADDTMETDDIDRQRQSSSQRHHEEEDCEGVLSVPASRSSSHRLSDGGNVVVVGATSPPVVPSLSERGHYVYGDGSDSAEAYSAVSVTSALVFGFAVTTFVTVEAGNNFVARDEEEDDNSYYTKGGHIAFGILMSTTIVLTAFGLLVMSLQYYQVRRMRVVQPQALRSFLKETFVYRHIARGTTWMALALYLMGLLCYSIIIWGRSSAVVAAIMATIFGSGAVAVVVVWQQLNDKYMKASGKRRTKHP